MDFNGFEAMFERFPPRFDWFRAMSACFRSSKGFETTQMRLLQPDDELGATLLLSMPSHSP